MNVAIIGESSKISQIAFESLVDENHRVEMFGRKNSKFHFDLLNQDYNQLSQFDMIIFIAHDHRPNRKIQQLIFRNYAQTLEFLETSGKKSIFLSTMSASATNRSKYSEQKRRLESLFTSHNFRIVRLGLVVGASDDKKILKAFKNISRLANLPFFRLCNASSGPFYTTNLDTVRNWFSRETFSNGKEVTSIYDVQFGSVSEFLASIPVSYTHLTLPTKRIV